MGRGLGDGFAVEAAAILAPGVIRSRGFWRLDLSIQSFGIDDFSLALGLMIEGVR